MNFDANDKSPSESYQAEAKERWGSSKAYAEYQEKAAVGADFNARGEELMALIAEIGQMRHLSSDDEKVRAKVRMLQEHITDNFYTCTDEILAGLAQMYVADERFRRNIDEYGGEGTAEFASAAISSYCGSNA